jgi:hypothetical protein
MKQEFALSSGRNTDVQMIWNTETPGLSFLLPVMSVSPRAPAGLIGQYAAIKQSEETDELR